MNNLQKPTDKELVRSFVAGDQQSFEKLRDRYNSTVTKTLNRETGRGGFNKVLSVNFEHTLEDLESETWLKIFKAIRKESLKYNEGMLGGYIVTIAKNTAFSFMAQRIKKRKVDNSCENATFPRHGDIEVDEPAVLPNNNRSPEAEYIDKNIIDDALEKLPKRAIKVLLMRNEGYNKEEISFELGISTSTVSNDLRKIQDLKL